MTQLWQFMQQPAIRSLLVILVVIVVVSILVRALRRSVRKRVGDGDLRYRASKLIAALGYAVVVVAVVMEFAGKFSGLAIALGAASAGVAFALQEVIASFAGWLAISFGGFYKVGDRVQVGGIKGDVIDIGLIRTTLMEIGGWVDGDQYNGRVVRVGNSFVFKEPVFNYSGEFPFVWDEIKVPVRYGSDRSLAKRILESAAREVVGDNIAEVQEKWDALVRTFRIEQARIEPLVTIVANDNWVEFTLRYTVDHKARRITKDRLFWHILDAFDASGGAVEMASATVQLASASTVRVNIEPPIATRSASE